MNEFMSGGAEEALRKEGLLRSEIFPRREQDESKYIEQASGYKETILSMLEGKWTDDSPNFKVYQAEAESAQGKCKIRVNNNMDFGMTVTISEKERGWEGQINETKITWSDKGVDYISIHSMPNSSTKGSSTARFHSGDVWNPEYGLMEISEAQKLIESSLKTS